MDKNLIALLIRQQLGFVTVNYLYYEKTKKHLWQCDTPHINTLETAIVCDCASDCRTETIIGGSQTD